jgi:tetratricopeptide (TPR) repeat protein
MKRCGTPRFRLAAILAAMTLACGTLPLRAWAETDPSACLSAGGEAAVTACRRDLRDDPDNVASRLALSEALMALKRYGEAIDTLKQGLTRDPGDETLKKKLAVAQSYLQEQQWIEKRQKRKRSVSRLKNVDTRIRLSLIRCTVLRGDAALAACNDGLKLAPNNSDLLTGRGNIRLDRDRIVKAMEDFKAALAADPENRDAADGLGLARAKRKIKVTQCMQIDGRDGLTACDAALLKGAPDAFSIQKRRAELLHTMGRDKEALAAYRAAARLRPQDQPVRRALTALLQPAQKPAPPHRAAGGESVAEPVGPAGGKAPPETGKVGAAAKPKPSRGTVAAGHKPPAAASAGKHHPMMRAKNAAPKAPPKAHLPAIDAGQTRRYSNAPEAPGITH